MRNINKSKTFLSFGGGVQTVALAVMCLEGDFPRPDYVIFADTGWETKGTYDYLKWFIPEMKNKGLSVHTVSKGNIREDALNNQKRFATMPVFTESDNGKYGMLRRQCTNEYKIQPVYRKIRDILGLKPYQRYKGYNVKLWLGISYDELDRMKDNRVKWIKNEFPLVYRQIRREDCLKYLSTKGYPLPPKSACIGCPFHSNDFWAWLKMHSPKEWEDACSFDESLRNHRVLIKNKVYLHRSLKPLRDIDFTDKQQDFGFREECDGYCGI